MGKILRPAEQDVTTSRRKLWVLWFAAGWVIAVGPLAAQPTERPATSRGLRGVDVEGVAGVIGSYSSGQEVDVILRSDVYLYAGLFIADQTESGSGETPESRQARTDEREEWLGAAYERILGEVLIAREARRVRIQEPSEALVENEANQMEAEAGGADRVQRVLESFAASRAEWDAIATRRAWVTAFLRVNLEGATTVTEAEVDTVQEAREEAGEAPLERSLVRAMLAKQALDRAVRRWVGVLRVRTFHRELTRFGSS